MSNMGKIHFFTGKGGVGKSTLALSKALQLARGGQKTLLVEFSQFNTMSRHLGREVGFTPVKWQEHLDVASWTGEDCLREYVRHSVKIRFIFDMFFRAKATNALIKAAPALKEISFLGYITSHLRGVEPQLHYDQIVVDAPATGHFISCLQVPRALLEIASVGPMGQHCRGIIEVLKNPEWVHVYTVFMPEPLVLNEQKELQDKLQEQFQITPRVLLNRSLYRKGIKEIAIKTKDLGFAEEQFIEVLKQNLELETSMAQSRLSQNSFPESFKLNFVDVAEELSEEPLWDVKYERA